MGGGALEYVIYFYYESKFKINFFLGWGGGGGGGGSG